MEHKFLLTMPVSLRVDIKRQAKKHGVTMNEYIVTVLQQFVDLQRSNSNGKHTERSNS